MEENLEGNINHKFIMYPKLRSPLIALNGKKKSIHEFLTTKGVLDMYKREDYNKTYYTSHKLGVAIGDREK